jgi:hypothetical protein
MDTVNDWTSGVLQDRARGATRTAVPIFQGGGYGSGDFPGMFSPGMFSPSMGYRVSDAPGGGDGGWKPPETFIAGHTKTTQDFIDQAQNPNVSAADFRSLADQYGNTPTYDWQGGQAAVATIGDYGETPVITAKQTKDFMGDYLDGSMGYTKNVIDATRDVLDRERGKRSLLSQMAMTAGGGGGGTKWGQGLADAEVTTDYLNNLMQITAELGDRGYTRAMQAGTGDADRTLSADTSTAGLAAQRLASMFLAQNAMNENNAARSQLQSMADQEGRYRAGLDTEAARLAGLTGQGNMLTQGSNVDLRNQAMLGTAAGIDQNLADRLAAEPLEMLKFRMASAGMLPNLTNTNTTQTIKPGLFDWAGLGLSAIPS